MAAECYFAWRMNKVQVHSMTGFGSASATIGDSTFRVEIKSLNAKVSDARVKLPSRFKDREVELRSHLLDRAGRGKYDLSVIELVDGVEELYGINEHAFKQAYDQLSVLSDRFGLQAKDLMTNILKIPSVISTIEQPVKDEEWGYLLDSVNNAINNLQEFRVREGNSIAIDLQDRVKSILQNLEAITPFEEERLEKVKKRIKGSLEDLVDRDNIDHNRLEQELIYYIEKLDINEERQRLTEHCAYFKEILEGEAREKGRQLSFLSQEMGREINTLGSKAQHAQIQRHVVLMKDELEKIKEQTANTM